MATLPGEYLEGDDRQRCTLSQLGTSDPNLVDNPDAPVDLNWKCDDANWTDDYDQNNW